MSRRSEGGVRAIRTSLTQGHTGCPLCDAKAAPLGESGGAVLFEHGSAGEAAVAVEVVGDGGVDRGEFLQTSHAPKPLHRPLASSERQVRVLRPVVQPATALLTVAYSDFLRAAP